GRHLEERRSRPMLSPPEIAAGPCKDGHPAAAASDLLLCLEQLLSDFPEEMHAGRLVASHDAPQLTQDEWVIAAPFGEQRLEAVVEERLDDIVMVPPDDSERDLSKSSSEGDGVPTAVEDNIHLVAPTGQGLGHTKEAKVVHPADDEVGALIALVDTRDATSRNDLGASRSGRRSERPHGIWRTLSGGPSRRHVHV